MRINPSIVLLIFVHFSLIVTTKPQIIECDYQKKLFSLTGYINSNVSYYRCNLDTSFHDYNLKPLTIVGNHEFRKNNADVKLIIPYKNNLLKILTAIFCENFKNLEAMEFNNAQMESVNVNALNMCKNLKYFGIISNKISEFPENLLIQNKILKIIRLNENQLMTLPESFFLKQRELETLWLNDNQISFLPSNIFQSLTNIKELQLDNNKLQKLNRIWFTKMRKLEFLTIHSNEITEVPPKIFNQLVNLEKLFLYDNKIEVLSSDSFEGLENLKLLSIFKNNIAELSRSIFVPLLNIEALDVSINKFSTIHSDSFGIHDDLIELHLDGNNMSAIDEKIFVNSNISKLNMTDNICANFYTENKNEIKVRLKTCFENYKQQADYLAFSERAASCGKSTAGVGNIIGGKFVARGSFPWVAVLVFTNGDYFCGGTLVSDRKVVTAAHCIQDKHEVKILQPSELIVLLGAHNLSIKYESGRKSVAVFNIHIHPAWNYLSTKYDADIAVLVLDEVITFNQLIQPICTILSATSIVASIYTGIVIGYGKSEVESKIHEETPKLIDTPIHDNLECFYRFEDLLPLSNERTFCGGYANGTGVCLGDSGSGLVVKHNGIYYLRGIVSSSIRANKYGCDVNKFSVFTNVLKFNDFINEIDVEKPYN